jgi:hypothetical protein
MNTHGMKMSFHFHSITLTGKEIGKDVMKRREGFLYKNFHFYYMENALAISDGDVISNSFPIIDKIFLLFDH